MKDYHQSYNLVIICQFWLNLFYKKAKKIYFYEFLFNAKKLFQNIYNFFVIFSHQLYNLKIFITYSLLVCNFDQFINIYNLSI